MNGYLLAKVVLTNDFIPSTIDRVAEDTNSGLKERIQTIEIQITKSYSYTVYNERSFWSQTHASCVKVKFLHSDFSRGQAIEKKYWNSEESDLTLRAA